MNDGLTEKDNKILLQALEGLAAVKLRSPGATTTEAPPTTPASLQGSPGSQLTPPDKKDIALINDPDLVHPLSGPTASPSEGLLVSEAEKPASTKQHKRVVSWGLNAPFGLKPRTTSFDSQQQPGRARGLLKQQSGNSSSPVKVSLKALLNHSPYESEMDARIQSAIEEADPTTGEKRKESILSHVPDEASRLTFDSTTKTAPAPGTLAKAHHKRAKTTAEDLFDLTNELQNLKHAHPRRSMSIPETVPEEGISSADALVRNAETLVQRNRLSVVESSSEQKSFTSKRFSRLSQTTLQDPKKTDEEVPEHDDADLEKGDEDDAHEEEEKCNGKSSSSSSGKGKKRKMRAVQNSFKDFENWLKLSTPSASNFITMILVYLIVPSTGIAAILYYAAGNPPCTHPVNCLPPSQLATSFERLVAETQASLSWWLLFLFSRQVVTFSSALVAQALLVDYLSLRTRCLTRLLGPMATLFIVQSKGWPLVLFWWGVFDFMFLYGDSKFSRNWLYWQGVIDLFNASNPSGNFTDNSVYRTLLSLALVVGFLVACKRFWLGLMLGKQTFVRYGEELRVVMKKSLLIAQVAALARDIEMSEIDLREYGLKVDSYEVDDGESKKSSNAEQGEPVDLSNNGLLRGMDLHSRRLRLNQLLGEWEEPEEGNPVTNVTIGSIIQFRQSLSYLRTPIPFSAAFGEASTREECIASSEAVYERLLKGISDQECLKFDCIALLALDKNGQFDEEKLKELIRLFRPDRDGNLSLLDFAKSVDTVYKELRLLRASIANSSRMDQAFENIINIGFYFILFFIVVAALGVDPFILFASVSGFVFSFTFMFGSATSTFFQGVMFILARRPYDLGDRINVSQPYTDTSTTGSPGWIVKDITLFTTTVAYCSTNEVATYSNGSLVNYRIINGARSRKAYVGITLQFPIDAPYQKLQVFKSAIEKFVEARPREWVACTACRATLYEANLGYVQYFVNCQHRESWQNAGAIAASKATLTNFALELSKRMGLRYRSPPMPIDLTMKEAAPTDVVPPRDDASDDFDSVARMFDA